MNQIERFAQVPRPPELQDAVMFWGKGEPQWQGFSNFRGGPIRLQHPHTGEEAEYASVEHWFQANKALTLEQHEWVRAAGSPGESKRRGRGVDLRPDWEQVKESVMEEGLRAKYTQIDWARELLLSTGERRICEDSPFDAIWGVRDRTGGFGGRDLLGKLLMKIREEIRAGEL